MIMKQENPMTPLDLFTRNLNQLILEGTEVMIRLPTDSSREMNDILSALQDQLVRTEKLSLSQEGS